VLYRKAALKKIPETDAIFAQLARVNAAADADARVLRLSLDAKATVLIGDYSRGGRSRLMVKAADHDFHPEEKLTPFGIFLPRYHELYLYFTTSKATSDFIVDCLQQFWLSQQDRFPQVKTLLLNLDNGPENHSRRTQFMQRIADFVDACRIPVDLAYYPPYHSKYNPIERVWGVLEQHWNGSLLDSCETVFQFAQTMRYKGQQPMLQFVQKLYPTGVRLTQRAMAQLEKRLDRLQALPKWFVRIIPAPSGI
jgi:transposase